MRRAVLPLFTAFVAALGPLAASAAPSEGQLPKQDARVLSEKCTVAVAADGRATTECAVEEEVHSLMAMDVFLDPRYRWVFGAQKFTLLEAYSVAPGTGKKVATPPHAINEVTPFGEELTPGASGWRETVVSHVGVVPGSRVVRRWRLEDVTAPARPFDARYPLQRVRPVDLLEYRFQGVAHVALVDPPSGCSLSGAPPSVTVTCRAVPGVGFAGVGAGRRIDLTDALVGRLPRVVVSAWPDAAALAAAEKALRYVPVEPGKMPTPEAPAWPGLFRKELELAPTPAARLEVLRVLVMTAFRALATRRAPVPLPEVFRFRAVTPLERALLFEAALREFVPEVRGLRRVRVSDHEVVAWRIPSLVEFPDVLVRFTLEGRELVFSPENGHLGPWPGLAGGAWVIDPAEKDLPGLVPGDRGPLRAVHAKAQVDASRITFTGQATWETFGEAPVCARMLPAALGRVERCEVLERAPGLVRVGFTSVAELEGEAVARLPGTLDLLGAQLFPVAPFHAGGALSFPVARARLRLELEWKPSLWEQVRVQAGSWVIPHREPMGYAAATITPGCLQGLHAPRSGGVVLTGECDFTRRHYYGAIVKPAVAHGFVGKEAFRESLGVGSLLQGRRTAHAMIVPLEVWFRRPAPPSPPAVRPRTAGGPR